MAVQIRRGAEVLGYDPENLSDQQRDEVKSALKNPAQNIFIASEYLANLKAESEFANVPADQMTPAQYRELAARYNGGPNWQGAHAQNYGQNFETNLGQARGSAVMPQQHPDSATSGHSTGERNRRLGKRVGTVLSGTVVVIGNLATLFFTVVAWLMMPGWDRGLESDRRRMVHCFRGHGLGAGHRVANDSLGEGTAAKQAVVDRSRDIVRCRHSPMGVYRHRVS